VFIIRRSLQETEAFKARKHHPSFREILRSILDNWRLVVLGMMLVVMTTVSFYLITVYAPTFWPPVMARCPSRSPGSCRRTCARSAFRWPTAWRRRSTVPGPGGALQGRRQRRKMPPLSVLPRSCSAPRYPCTIDV
jgi:hypothetical protein